MCKTRHIQQRMSQRCITKEMIDIAMNFGKVKGDRVIFNRKGIDALLTELEKMKKNALKMRERGGVVVVNVDNFELTTYALNSYRRG